MPAVGALREREGEAADRHQDAGHEARAKRRVGEHERTEQRRVQREHAEQHRRQPRGDVLLAPVDQSVGEREREQREDRRQPDVGAHRPTPRGGDREQHEAGEGEPDARAQQRGTVLQAELDRHPGAGPDDDEQRVEGEHERTAHHAISSRSPARRPDLDSRPCLEP
jgi:hypothetical protein